MSDIESLQARLAQALDALERRITADAADAGAPVAPAPSDTAELDQLREQAAALQAEDSKQKTAIMALERGLAEMRAANASLVKANAALESGDAGDAALHAELAAMRADRQTEQAEVAALLVALGPLVQEMDADA